MKFWQVASFCEPEQLLDVARIADEVGFHGILISDHVCFPGTLTSRYPYSRDGKPGFDASTPFPEPWTTISAMAAVTTRLRFATMVYILPLRHPLEVAKSVGTAALLSGNRVALGAGAGWIREEYEALGVDFPSRGRRFDEMIGVLRALWTGKIVEQHGEFFEFEPLAVNPVPSASVPIYVGGASPPALRRAARLADGWIGTGQAPEEARDSHDRLAELRREAGKEAEPFETIVPLVVAPDVELLRRLETEHAMTATTCYPFHYTLGPRSSIEEKREVMVRFGETVIAKLC